MISLFISCFLIESKRKGRNFPSLYAGIIMLITIPIHLPHKRFYQDMTP
jgi:hypothetical protein